MSRDQEETSSRGDHEEIVCQEMPLVRFIVDLRRCEEIACREMSFARFVVALRRLVPGEDAVARRSRARKSRGAIAFRCRVPGDREEEKQGHLRYIPLLWETFTFSQSLGIIGGRPGASTYIVGVQDDKAIYLDPHEVQPVVDIKTNDLEADTSSYHSSTVRYMPLDLIDPSLAIGFYCRDKDDFEDFCSRASDLADRSNGAPLFTVARSLEHLKPKQHMDSLSVRLGYANDNDSGVDDNFHLVNTSNYDSHGGDDDWQVL